MDMYQKRKIRAEKKKDDSQKSLPSTSINCEKPIYINIDSNYWKYWIFDVVIFTFFISRIINKVDR